jgi:hypothetical protein
MPVPRVETSISVEDNVSATLDAVATKVADLTSWFKQVADEIVFPEIQDGFARGGRPRWTPLTPKTQKWKNAIGAGGQPILTLVATTGKRSYNGELRDSLSHRHGHNTTITKSSMTISPGNRLAAMRAGILASGAGDLAGPRVAIQLTKGAQLAIQRHLRAYLKKEVSKVKAPKLKQSKQSISPQKLVANKPFRYRRSR